MASIVTIDAIVSAALERASMENSVTTPGGIITTATAFQLANYALAELYEKLVAARGQEYYRAQYAFNTSGGTSLYALPAGHMETISVDFVVGAGWPNISGKKFNESQRNALSFMPGWNYWSPFWYRLEGSNIHLLPIPNGIFPVIINYVPAFVPLTTGQTFDGVNGWEEYAIWRAAGMMLAKEESDTSFCDREVAMLGSRIEKMADDRHAGEPETIQTTASNGFGGWGGGWY